MPLKKPQPVFNSYWLFISSLIFFVLGGLLGCYLCRSLRPFSTTNAPIPENTETKKELYENFEYGFSLQYPVGSKIDQLNQDYVVKIEPPAKFALDETELVIRVVKESFGESINESLKQDLQNSSRNVFTGILTYKIDGLPIKRFYTITCPELGSNCEKANKYYVNAKGNTYIITATTFTDVDSNPINEEVTEEIISSIKF